MTTDVVEAVNRLAVMLADARTQFDDASGLIGCDPPDHDLCNLCGDIGGEFNELEASVARLVAEVGHVDP